ncbi:MAG: Septum formation initiator [Gemmatimonadetes bacterium]|jgi:cell division protein FtsB|nr:Septum formation initiator [Gemmatimonadota bacterium]
MAADRSAILKRVGTIALIGVALWFAVQGGEFGTLDLFRQYRQKARVSKSVDSLKLVVDSLKKYEDKLLHDPATQERIAREVFGMVRGDKEVLYRFADPRDTTGKTP